MVEGLFSQVPAVKCSYCGDLHQDEDKEKMGFESDNWAIDFKCFKKVCDKVLGGGKK